MALNKFYSGLPYYHQGDVAGLFGCKVSASTIYDQCAVVADVVRPVFDALKRLAGNACQFLLDDTHHRILGQQPELRDKANGKGQVLRTGVYASGLIAELRGGYEVVLFETSLGHAGEHLDDILQHRQDGLPPPLTMSDALSSNLITKLPIKAGYCNAHARRQFVDIESRFPEQVEWVLDNYAKIWEHDATTKEKQLTPEERLAYHQEHSLPVMQSLKAWCEAEQAKPDHEEHSVLGKAIKYFVKHYERLILFCVESGALIDNNRMEEKLKIVIRGRKTAHFYKTAKGAGVANVLISIIATANNADVNVYDYLQALQKHADHVQQSPEAWLPWNYHASLDPINAQATATA